MAVLMLQWHSWVVTTETTLLTKPEYFFFGLLQESLLTLALEQRREVRGKSELGIWVGGDSATEVRSRAVSVLRARSVFWHRPEAGILERTKEIPLGDFLLQVFSTETLHFKVNTTGLQRGRSKKNSFLTLPLPSSWVYKETSDPVP